MRKPTREIGQIPLLYRAICGIRILRDQLLGAFIRDYAWSGNWL
jgi:hypothetical protein